MCSQAACIFDLVDLEAALARADAVITSEGRVDPTSWQGKAPGQVTKMARAFGKPAAIVCGQSAGEAPDGILFEVAGQGRTAAPTDLARAAERAVSRLLA